MEIEFNPGNSSLFTTNQPVVRREPASAPQKTMSFDQTQALERTLKSSSSVRPDKVARANALVADANYPSDADLGRLAGLLATHLSPQEA